MLVTSLTVGPVQTNCYILADETTKDAALIDPGDYGTYLVREARKAGCKIRMILLTHGHFDHIGGVKDALQALRTGEEGPVPVYVHQADYPVAPSSFARHITLNGVENIHFYGEGDTLSLAGHTIHVLSTPGHTEGGVCLLVEDCLFTGDTLFCGSCGRTDFATSSPEAMLLSLRRLAQLPDDYDVYPGHDRATRLSTERQKNPYVRYALTQNL